MLNNFPSHSKYYVGLNSKGANNSSLNRFGLDNASIHKLSITNSTCDLSSFMWPLADKANYLDNTSVTLVGRNNLTVTTSNIDLLISQLR